MRTNIVTCKIAYPKLAIGRLTLISNGLATNFRHFSNNFASPFWVWTCVTGCSTSIPIDIQYSWKIWDVISLVLSKQICDDLVDASIKTMKYLNGPLGGCIGPQISPCICSENEIESFLIFLVMVLLSTFLYECTIHFYS